MSTWTCNECQFQFRAVSTGQSFRDHEITIYLPWTDEVRPVVRTAGENRYPCPDCEGDNITHWDNVDARLFSRLRNHYPKEHGMPLTAAKTQEELIAFHVNSRRLRCQLLSGPTVPENATPRVETPAQPQPGTSSGSSHRHMRHPIDRKRKPSPSFQVSVHKKLKSLSKLQDNSNIPMTYVKYLRKDSGLATNTIESYLVVIRRYLGWIEDKHGIFPDLNECWNIDWLQKFIVTVKESNAKATTVYNYLCALRNVQQFLQTQGDTTPSEKDQRQMLLMLKQASKTKKEHQRKAKQKQILETPKLEKVNARVVRNKNNKALFKCLLKKCKDPASHSPYKGVLSVQEFKWVTAYVIMQLQSSNFKRNGNLMKISVNYAHNRLLKNLRKCRLAKEKGKEAPACHLKVIDGTKTKGFENFTITKSTKKKIILDYIKWIRANGPHKVKCSELFINTRGKSLRNKFGEWLKYLGKGNGIENLNIRNMRTSLETKAAEHAKDVDRDEITRHLSHTKDTRDKHYLVVTNKSSTNAAEDIEK